MKADDLWKMFMETGDIIFYLLYKEELKKEENETAKAG